MPTAYNAMRFHIIAIAMWLTLLCPFTSFAQSAQTGQTTREVSIGLQARATVIHGLHISGMARGILISDTSPRTAAYIIEVSGTSLTDINLMTVGNLKPSSCSTSDMGTPLPLKRVRYCGVHTVYSHAVILVVQEVL